MYHVETICIDTLKLLQASMNPRIQTYNPDYNNLVGNQYSFNEAYNKIHIQVTSSGIVGSGTLRYTDNFKKDDKVIVEAEYFSHSGALPYIVIERSNPNGASSRITGDKVGQWSKLRLERTFDEKANFAIVIGANNVSKFELRNVKITLLRNKSKLSKEMRNFYLYNYPGTWRVHAGFGDKHLNPTVTTDSTKITLTWDEFENKYKDGSFSSYDLNYGLNNTQKPCIFIQPAIYNESANIFEYRVLNISNTGCEIKVFNKTGALVNPSTMENPQAFFLFLVN